MTGMRLRLAFSSVGRCSSDLQTLASITITPSTPIVGGVVEDLDGLLLTPTILASTPHHTCLFF
jgi:hypothetical protein